MAWVVVAALCAVARGVATGGAGRPGRSAAGPGIVAGAAAVVLLVQLLVPVVYPWCWCAVSTREYHTVREE